MLSSPLIQTTLLHYLSLIPIFAYSHVKNQRLYSGYAVIITLSSTLSTVWHYMGEPDNEWLVADYSAAAMWGIYNIILVERIEHALLARVIYLECMILAMNHSIDYCVRKKLVNYVDWHSCWHVASAIKSLYISYLLCSR